jgi:hydrogenase maturation factor
VVTLAGIVMTWRSHDWRLGIRVVAGALTAAAVLRLLLPQKDAGMLAVRHRLFDVAVVGVIAVALFVLASSIPDQPT